LIDSVNYATCKSKYHSQIRGDKMNRLMKIEYPADLPDILNETHEEFEAEAKLAMVMKLFESGRISSGIAANIIGIDRVSFLRKLSTYKVSTMNFQDTELLSDIENA